MELRRTQAVRISGDGEYPLFWSGEMSHFAVLVIGEDVERQLQPYHEFECTGDDDEFVQDIDKTKEAREKYGQDTTTRLKDAAGEFHSFFDERGEWRHEFSQPDPKDHFGRRIKYIPAGYEEVELHVSQVETFVEWVSGYYGLPILEVPNPPKDEHKYGYVLVCNGGVDRIIKRTNPNKKWDWWSIGGRWSGFLKLKNGATGQIGRKGLIGSCSNDGPGYADVARKADIDFDGMRDAAGQRAADAWDKANAARNGETWQTWEHLREVVHKGNIDAAREAYNAQPAMVAVRKAFDNPFHNIDDYLMIRDQFIQQDRDKATVTYAFVKDGQWFARGEMGWFGLSDDKVGQDEWFRKVNELLDSLPDETTITVVDCHI